jgi:IMP dehydrogenase
MDEDFYLKADDFFSKSIPTGFTFDDLSLATRYSEVIPRDVRLDTNISESIKLSIPILSSDMDTVTESDMAIAMALCGGIGLIHYNMSPRNQVKEVARVKYHVHGLIQDPITITADKLVGDVLELIEDKNFQFRTFPIVDDQEKLLGLLPGRVVKKRYKSRKVTDGMLARNEVYTIKENEVGHDPIATADKFFSKHMGIHKLLVVDKEDKLRGLYTLSDIERIMEENRDHLKPARDSKFRLLCGAAVSTPRKKDGQLDKDSLGEHVSEMVEQGLDSVAVSTAHGHTKGVGEATRFIRESFPDLTIIAGNVTSGEGVEFLADAGANAIKVGQGPGSICTTRIVAGVGIPQMTALYAALQGAKKKGVSIIADGGISKSGDIVKALTLAKAVICGGLLAGCREAPGRIIEIEGKYYKQYRGMGSLEAMKEGSASRYGHKQEDLSAKSTPEGVEALKEVAGSVKETLEGLVGGIRAGLGYLGAERLDQLYEKARYIQVSPAGQRESGTHDVIEVKRSDFARK